VRRKGFVGGEGWGKERKRVISGALSSPLCLNSCAERHQVCFLFKRKLLGWGNDRGFVKKGLLKRRGVRKAEKGASVMGHDFVKQSKDTSWSRRGGVPRSPRKMGGKRINWLGRVSIQMNHPRRLKREVKRC